MLFVGQHFLIRLPKVGEAVTGAKGGGDALPEFLTSRGAAVTCHIGNDLPGLAAQGDPDPILIGFFQHK